MAQIHSNWTRMLRFESAWINCQRRIDNRHTTIDISTIDDSHESQLPISRWKIMTPSDVARLTGVIDSQHLNIDHLIMADDYLHGRVGHPERLR